MEKIKNFILLILLAVLMVTCGIVEYQTSKPVPVISDELDPFHELYTVIDPFSEEVAQ